MHVLQSADYITDDYVLVQTDSDTGSNNFAANIGSAYVTGNH